MSSDIFTEEEYLNLVRRLADEQYDQTDDFDPAEAFTVSAVDDLVEARKQRMQHQLKNGTIDLTKVKKDKLLSSLFKHNTIKVYDFTIRISEYHGEPSKTGANLSVTVTLYHERHKTELSGAPCNIVETFNIGKDNRFSTRPWLSYFTGCHGKRIPPDVLVEIIRWMQVVKKLPAFL
jgi:hypothetical protein